MRSWHLDPSISQFFCELLHCVFFAVHQERTLRAGLLLPSEQLRLISMRGETIDGVDSSPNRKSLAQNVHLFGAVDNLAGKSPNSCVTDEYDGRILTADIVLEVVRGRLCTCPSPP